jgi:hypothetical protein
VRDRRIVKYRPDLEPMEAKQLLNAGPVAPVAPGHHGNAEGQSPAAVEVRNHLNPAQAGRPHQAARHHQRPAGPFGVVPKPTKGFLVFRLTNPSIFNNHFNPPLRQQVMVQSRPPIPGQQYNILFFTLRNGTAQTFDASSGFKVRMSKQHTNTPILTGDQTWKPGEVFVFYVLTKKYYPVDNQVSGGFLFNLGGARSLAIPGPSGIFQRITYNPKTFSQMLASIVVNGPGNQGGVGIKTGIANTSITEFVNAKTNRNDFGGYF